MSDTGCSFNLWQQPWIRVTRPDGTSAELGIGACLAEAHALVALHDPSPLVVVGVHRLLAAVLQSIYAPQNLGEIEAVLRAGRFDLARLAAFAAQHGERFDLFHPTAPFLQTGDVPLDGWKKPERGQKHDWADPKPVAALFAEVPVETNRSLFNHVTDEQHQVCPACCARGLLTIPSFASSGGSGIRPSINGVPPIYVLPAASSLFESLALSLIARGYQPPAADPDRVELALWSGSPFVGKNIQVSAIGYLESLLFPARRVRLYPQQEGTYCTHCGTSTAIVVRNLLFEMGHWRAEGGSIWEDPFVAFRKPKGREKSEEVGPRPVRPEEGKAMWREYGGLLLAERDMQLRPRVVQQIGRLVDDAAIDMFQLVRFRCIGIRTDGKAKVFEWIDEALEVPPPLLTDPYAEYLVDGALRRAEESKGILEWAFDRHFRPARDREGRDNKRVRMKVLRARMVAAYWRQLAPQFRSFVFSLADEATREAAERDWANRLVATGQKVFDDAAVQAGTRADALKARVEAQAECSRRLVAKRKEWFGEQQ